MAKANPLFIDSTKMHGDSIGTQVELSRVVLYEGEDLFVLITNHLGEVREVRMSINEDLSYQTRVWLNHQKTFSYRFVINQGEKHFLQSVEKKARAQYAIVDRWEPVLAEARAVSTGEEFESATALGPSIPDHVKSVASLIDKFGF